MMKIDNKQKEIISNEIINIFNKNKLRLTETRWEIINVFLDEDHAHTIKEVRRHLTKLGYSLTVATIYNTIWMLMDLGILLAFFDRKKQEPSFELNILKDKIHTHFFDLDKQEYSFLENSKSLQNIIEQKCNENGYELEFGILALNVRKKKDQNN